MSDDVIALLKAHDPEPSGSWAPPIERMLARLDAEPRPAPRPSRLPRPVRPRRPLAAALATGVTAVVLASLAIGLGGARTDVVAAARAAIAGGDAIVHTVTRTTAYNPDGRPVTRYMNDNDGRRRIGEIGTVERWSATSPVRWRGVTHLLPGPGMPGGTDTVAYAGGVVRSQQSWNDRTSVGRYAPPGSAPASDGLLNGTEDPLAAVRAMLASGEVREDGEAVRDGRRVLRLVGETPKQVNPMGLTPAARVVYLVDAETHAPVEVERQIFLPGRDGQQTPGPIVRIVFERYEQLPLTPENEQLLELGNG